MMKMRKGSPYRRILAYLALRGVSTQELASAIGIRYDTLRGKLAGTRAFTLKEALAIKHALDFDGPVEMLFEEEACNI